MTTCVQAEIRLASTHISTTFNLSTPSLQVILLVFRTVASTNGH